MKLWWPLVHSNLVGLVGDLTRFHVVGENKTLEVLTRQDILGLGDAGILFHSASSCLCSKGPKDQQHHYTVAVE
jgi:hypothetical protein